jgi:hypothetical protein
MALVFKNYEGVYALLDLGFNMKLYGGGALRDAVWEGELEMVR